MGKVAACNVNILYPSASYSVLIQLPANKPVKAVGDDSSTWAPAAQVGFLDADFLDAWSWLLQLTGA